MRKSVVLGITGGIGSGKSYISQLLRQEGVPVYDCDSRAKELNNVDPYIRKALVELVGENVYDGSGLVKPVLAAFLFASKDNAERVNAIVHPVVRRDFEEWVSGQRAEIVGVESAILYESGFDSLADFVLYVSASEEVRIARAMKRDGVERDRIVERIRLQGAFSDRADFVLENEGRSDEELINELNEIIQSIKYKL